MISCLLHAGIFLSFDVFKNTLEYKEKDKKQLYINYFKLEQNKKQEIQSSVVKPRPKSTKVPKIAKESLRENKKNESEQKKQQGEARNITEEIILPKLPKDFPNRKQYLDYYKIVREKIKLYADKNYVGNTQGEVFLRFIVLKNGYLKDLTVAQAVKSNNDFLKNIAIKSVRYASPFPKFPDEIKYSELKFNIIIEFKSD